MRKIFSALLLLVLFCSFFYEKPNNMPMDINKFFIKELNYRDFSNKKIPSVDTDIDRLHLVDSCYYICLRDKNSWSSSAEYYYFSIIDTTYYYSYVYYYFNEAKVGAFILANYDKKGKSIDHVTISSFSGDEGWYYHSEGIFVNDSIIIRTDIEGEQLEWIEEKNISIDTILSLNKYRILLKKDGRIDKLDITSLDN
jgi:hypothetical protein